MIDVHRRRVGRELSSALLPGLLDPGARLWPADVWPALALDNVLNVGSRGGHGPIRYHVIESEPHRVRFAFDDMDGWHEFRLEGEVAVHEARIRLPSAKVRYFVVHLHDALIEHLLDDVEASGGRYPRRRWPAGTRWRYLLTAMAQKDPGRRARNTRRLVAGAIGSIGVLHLIWATGSSFPARTRAGLAQSVIGSTRGAAGLPSTVPTVAVGGALAALAGLVAVQPNSVALHAAGGPSGSRLNAALRVAEAGFGARGLIGLIAPTGARHPRYRLLNAVAYSPLCLLLAAGLHALLSVEGVAGDPSH